MSKRTALPKNIAKAPLAYDSPIAAFTQTSEGIGLVAKTPREVIAMNST